MAGQKKVENDDYNTTLESKNQQLIADKLKLQEQLEEMEKQLVRSANGGSDNSDSAEKVKELEEDKIKAEEKQVSER